MYNDVQYVDFEVPSRLYSLRTCSIISTLHYISKAHYFIAHQISSNYLKMKATTHILTVFLATIALPKASQGFVAPSNLGCRGVLHRQISFAQNRIETKSVGVAQKYRTSSTSGVNMQDTSTTEEPSLNVGLIAQNVANQALIGITIWTGGVGYQVLTQNAQFDTSAILLGVAGLVPLLAISRAIETSESYALSGLNLSTNMAVLRLFGASPRPIAALLVSAFMAGLTGIVEETTFRGQAIPFLTNRLGDGDTLTGAFLATLLFAFLHTNPASFLKGGEAALDNLVLLALQFVNGAIFAFLYLSTGNLAVPIIAHGLYDFYTFYKTHLVDVAGQMSYASRESMMPNFSNRALEQRWIKERGEDFVMGVKQSFYLMDTNRDGVLCRKELRVALFSYGINLSKFQSEQVYQKADLDENSNIDLDEFLSFVGPTGSTGRAVRSTLFGPI